MQWEMVTGDWENAIPVTSLPVTSNYSLLTEF